MFMPVFYVNIFFQSDSSSTNKNKYQLVENSKWKNDSANFK